MTDVEPQVPPADRPALRQRVHVRLAKWDVSLPSIVEDLLDRDLVVAAPLDRALAQPGPPPLRGGAFPRPGPPLGRLVAGPGSRRAAGAGARGGRGTGRGGGRPPRLTILAGVILAFPAARTAARGDLAV